MDDNLRTVIDIINLCAQCVTREYEVVAQENRGDYTEFRVAWSSEDRTGLITIDINNQPVRLRQAVYAYGREPRFRR